MRERIGKFLFGKFLSSYWTSLAMGLFLIGEIIFFWNIPELPQYWQDFAHYIFMLVILITIFGLILLWTEHKKRGAK